MEMMVSLKDRSYPITIEPGILAHCLENLDPNKKYALITDSGVPKKWVDMAARQLHDPLVLTFEQGEPNKSFETYRLLLEQLAEAKFTRKDAIIAIGGGVVGDLAGFVASTYMRGIDFYNIPSTLLSMVDSSVGGKTAIDLGPLKNIVGAFWQPKAVWIDPDCLSTLDERQKAAGLAEALKMGLILDPALYEAFLQEDLDVEWIIAKAVDLKREIVEEDEREGGKRKILNFGHTIGHGLEASFEEHAFLHGECVAMGMLYFLKDPVIKEKVIEIERKLNLPDIPEFDADAVMEALSHDKKGAGSSIDVITVDQPGSWAIESMPLEQIEELLERDVYEEHLWQ